LSYETHVKMQATFQQYLDGGCSKTINFSKEAKVEDIYNAFMLSYKSGCKGITAYRDGSRPYQDLSTKKEERKVFNRTTIMKGETEKIKTTLGNLMLTINRNSSGQPGEVILNIGKSGADITAFSEALGRLISVSLQHGVSVKKLADQLKNIKGEDIIFHNGEKYTSIPDLIGKKIESSEISKEKVVEDKEAVLSLCPECSARLYRGEGCITCQSCGYSKC
jgi:ribonucleoside-diphosphate reductase alpha chain